MTESPFAPSTPLQAALNRPGAVGIPVVAKGVRYTLVRRGGEVRCFAANGYERAISDATELKILISWPREPAP